MVTSNNKKLVDKIRIAALHGLSRDAWKRYQGSGTWYYEVVMPGFKYNMTDVAAAMGIEQLKKSDLFQKKRQAIAKKYNKAFTNIEGLKPLSTNPYGSHSWHLYVIKLDLGKIKVDRTAFIDRLKNMGVGTSVHFIPLHMQPYWKKAYHLKEKDFPIASKVYEQIVSLPIYPKMTNQEIQTVIKSVKIIIKENKK